MSKQPCRFANDPVYPCDADLSRVDVQYHYSRNHLTKPTYEELVTEIEGLKDLIADLKKEKA